MTPYWQDDHLTVWQGDCREVMAAMEPESVHCVVTSPPYWGLRDYGTATWIGGDEGCDHKDKPTHRNIGFNERWGRPTGDLKQETSQEHSFTYQCDKCGAVRQDSQLGLEPTPEEFVANMVDVFRAVKRVLRKDGTLWLNLGDSYAGTANGRSRFGQGGGEKTIRRPGYEPQNEEGSVDRPLPPGLKPKDLVGIPWRVAFALQADGWYLRSDIIWSKPNPMPESVTDRPTKAHEYLFLLTKSARYFYDADAVREEHTAGNTQRQLSPDKKPQAEGGARGSFYAIGGERYLNPLGRNLRSVWSIATEPYPGAHFATFPRKLVEPCVKAGTSERGVCGECGAPWTREVETGDLVRDDGSAIKLVDPIKRDGSLSAWSRPGGKVETVVPNSHREKTTTGWRPSCAHGYCPVCYNAGDARTVGGLPGVRQDIPAEGPPSIGDLLLEGVRESSNGQDSADDEGLRAIPEGIHPPLSTGPSDGDADGLHRGASAGDGRGPWADAGLDGSSGSHQRDQGRQPAREPAGDDEEGARRLLEPRAEADGVVPGVRSPLRAQGTCGQCGGDLRPLEPVPSIVLDCFAGSGTTGMVAQALGRRAVLIDLSADYLLQLMSRNQQTPLGMIG